MSIKERTLSFLIYAAKCITGTLLAYLLSSFTPYLDVGWCLVSVVLTLSPDGKDSIEMAITRIKANTVGGIVGFICLLIAPGTIWMVVIALICTMFLCYLFRLEVGIRAALAATVLIMLRRRQYLWDSPLERMVSVIVGCLLALIATYIFHFKITSFNRKDNSIEEG